MKLAASRGASAARSPEAAAVAQFGDNGQLEGQQKGHPDTPRELDAAIESVTPLAGGLFRLVLDNGQIWTTREADWALGFKAGNAVSISRMALGGYQIAIKGNPRSVGIRRVK